MIAPPILAQPFVTPPIVEEKHHHTVINGVIQHLSVSQLNSFNPEEDGGCNLRWMYAKVLGKKEPEHDFNVLGTQVHNQQKHFLTTGEDVLGEIARAGLHLLPRKDSALRVEWGLHDKPQPVDKSGKAVNYFPPQESLVTAAGVKLIGFIDLIDPRPDHILPDGSIIHEPGTVEVIDHKTTSGFKWAKEGEKLIYTSQMPGYGMFVAAKYPWAKQVRLSHIYYLTKGAPEAKKKTHVFSMDEIKRRWHSVVEPMAENMKAVAALKDEHEVEGNLNACEAFRGCAHKAYCHTYKNQSALKRIKMGLLKSRNAAPAAVNGSAAATNGATATNTTPWIGTPPPQVGAAAVEAAPKKTLGSIFKDTSTPDVPAAAGLLVGAAVAGVDYVTPAGAVVNFSSEAGPGWRVFTPKAGGPPQVLDSNSSLTVVPPPAPPAPPPAVAAPAKRGPGRPKKNANAAEAAGAAPAAEAAEGIELFINAIPSGPFTDLITYVSEITNDMQETFKVPDIRVAPNDSEIGYRRWEGALVAAVKQQPPAPGTYVAFTKGNQLVEIAAEALASVYQATRGV